MATTLAPAEPKEQDVPLLHVADLPEQCPSTSG